MTSDVTLALGNYCGTESSGESSGGSELVMGRKRFWKIVWQATGIPRLIRHRGGTRDVQRPADPDGKPEKRVNRNIEQEDIASQNTGVPNSAISGIRCPKCDSEMKGSKGKRVCTNPECLTEIEPEEVQSPEVEAIDASDVSSDEMKKEKDYERRIVISCPECGEEKDFEKSEEITCKNCGRIFCVDKEGRIVKSDLLELDTEDFLKGEFSEVDTIVKDKVWVVGNEKEYYTALKVHDLSVAERFHSLPNGFIPRIVRTEKAAGIIFLNKKIDGTLRDLIDEGKKIEAIGLLRRVLRASIEINKRGVALTTLEPEIIGHIGGSTLVLLSPMAISEIDKEFTDSIANSYTAPEVGKGGKITPNTDSYSIAAILYEVVLGRKLSQDKSPDEIAENTDKPNIAQLLWQPLQVDAEKRFVDGRGLLTMLDSFMSLYQSKEVSVEYAVKTSIGRNPSRKTNQDSAGSLALQNLIGSTPYNMFFFAVADGMGGGIAGDEASKTAVLRSQMTIIENLGTVSGEEIDSLAKKAVVEANNGIMVVRKNMNIGKNSMGTTFTCVLIYSDRFVTANVGDSRVYMYSSEGLELLTKDHSVVQEMVDANEITLEQARTHKDKSIITRVLGEESIKESFVDGLDVRRGTSVARLPDEGYFVLCTDGVWEAFPESVIAKTIEEHKTPYAIAEELVKKAVKEDGSDNSTILVVKFETRNLLRDL